MGIGIGIDGQVTMPKPTHTEMTYAAVRLLLNATSPSSDTPTDPTTAAGVGFAL
jgi:hypothetical protein